MDYTLGFQSWLRLDLMWPLVFLLVVAGITEGGWNSRYRPYCYFKECCNDRWITKDYDALQRSLEENVFGQHLVHSVIYAALKGHANFQPHKPLVLSFHGSTGTGKNFVSHYIAESWFKKGMKSKYVTLLTATKDFAFGSRLDEYKRTLQQLIVKHTSSCEYHIFIFDEIDSFPPGLLDSIRSYLEYNPNVDGVDYRKTIFIFLSNIGDMSLRKLTAKYYDEGKARDDMTLKETEKVMIPEIFSSKDAGLSRSRLIDANLVSHFVPFLPLERQHVHNCIRKQLSNIKQKHNVERFINEVMMELQFTSPDGREIFSVKGCKNVAEKVNYVGVKYMYNKPLKTEL